MKAIYNDPVFLKKVTAFDIRPLEGRVFSHTGREFLALNGKGYVYCYVSVRNKTHHVKRFHLIWWKTHGVWPKGLVDHDDRNRSNDKISNLKDATHRQNCHNKHKASGLPPGVTESKGRLSKPYAASIKIAGKSTFLGRYATPEEAHAEYLEAVREVEENA